MLKRWRILWFEERCRLRSSYSLHNNFWYQKLGANHTTHTYTYYCNPLESAANLAGLQGWELGLRGGRSKNRRRGCGKGKCRARRFSPHWLPMRMRSAWHWHCAECGERRSRWGRWSAFRTSPWSQLRWVSNISTNTNDLRHSPTKIFFRSTGLPPVVSIRGFAYGTNNFFRLNRGAYLEVDVFEFEWRRTVSLIFRWLRVRLILTLLGMP